MSRARRDLAALLAVLGVAAFAVAPAQAKALKRHHVAHVAHGPRVARAPVRPAPAFPTYVDQGSDYNPGSDNLYFSDTKVPHYIVGPAWFQRWEE